MPVLDYMRSVSYTELLNTGTWSIFQPRFVNSVAPCMDACPASIDMPRVYDLLRKGEVEQAALLMLRFNPFPFITGQICPQFCGESCNRGDLDQPVAIREIEEWLGGEILDRGILPKPAPFCGKRVLVVGSGPAGLSAAWYLALAGIEVTVCEREPVAGGMLAWGIPPFRFNRGLLREALKRLEDVGVVVNTSVEITPEELRKASQGFNAVLVATGLSKARVLPQVQPGRRVLLGLEVLKGFNLKGELPHGTSILVVGGGNVAVDVARVFARAGRNVTMACVETRSEMPAIEEEIHQALQEGVELLCSVGLKEVNEQGGQVAVSMGRVEVVDDSAPLKKVSFVGQTQVGMFDLVVLAVGQESRWQWSDGEDVVLAGDLATGPSSVAGAFASGREAARRLIAEFNGSSYCHLKEEAWERDSSEVVSFNDLNPHNLTLFSHNPLPGGIPREVGNCLTCGYCNGCGTCWFFCPDASILLEQPPTLDADHCKGCGICATECPRGVVFMRKRG